MKRELPFDGSTEFAGHRSGTSGTDAARIPELRGAGAGTSCPNVSITTPGMTLGLGTVERGGDLDVINAFGTALVRKRGVNFDSFLLDDG